MTKKYRINHIIPRIGGITLNLKNGLDVFSEENEECLGEIKKCQELQSKCNEIISEGLGERNPDRVFNYGCRYKVNK